jgi:16S rRNA (cytidine1402-2'-O)-methyltransferase
MAIGRSPQAGIAGMNDPRNDPGDPSRSYTVEGHRITAPSLEPGLYVVSTPIGNLGDTTLRALATLAAADLVACEDTRVTSVLLRRYGIASRLVAYHDHNAAKERPRLLAALGRGAAIALVSDAGTPLVSDPGYRLALEARAAGHRVMPVPGASAVLAGLVASGLPSDAFMFAGFVAVKPGARAKRLGELKTVPATLIFFESPKRIAASLAAMADAFGHERAAAVVRELTKIHETVRRGTLAELAAAYGEEAPPKGEIVVVVGPPSAEETSAEDADQMLKSLLETHSVSAAAAEAAALTGLPRRQLYARALALKSGE